MFHFFSLILFFPFLMYVYISVWFFWGVTQQPFMSAMSLFIQISQMEETVLTAWWIKNRKGLNGEALSRAATALLQCKIWILIFLMICVGDNGSFRPLKVDVGLLGVFYFIFFCPGQRRSFSSLIPCEQVCECVCVCVWGGGEGGWFWVGSPVCRSISQTGNHLK